MPVQCYVCNKRPCTMNCGNQKTVPSAARRQYPDLPPTSQGIRLRAPRCSHRMCHIAQKVIPSVGHSTQVTSVYRDPAASLVRQREGQVPTYAGPSSCDQCCTAVDFHCTRPDEGCFHCACSISLVSHTNMSRPCEVFAAEDFA